MMNNEHRLQADIVIWYRNTFPDRRGSLWGNFAEQNAAQASMKLALGLVRGLSDLMFVDDEGRLIGIELKYPNTRHNAQHLLEQAWWLQHIPYKGYFCDSLAMAQGILLGKGEGIDPQKVIDYIKQTNKKSILWNFQ